MARESLDLLRKVYGEVFPKMTRVIAEDFNSNSKELVKLGAILRADPEGNPIKYMLERVVRSGLPRVLEKAEIEDLLNIAIPLGAWEMSKAVYRFSDNLFESLMDSDRDSVMSTPVSLLAKLPEWCFYVETPLHDTYEGIMVCNCMEIKKEERTGKEFNVAYTLNVGLHKNKEDYSVMRIYYLAPNSKKVERVKDSAIELLNMARESSGEATEKRSEKLLYTVVPLLTYMVAVNAEMPEYRSLKSQQRAVRNPDKQTPKTMLIGEKIGSALGRLKVAYIGEVKSNNETGATVKPHLRKAHMQHYWVGPRSEGQKGTGRVERWIPPIFVNSKGEEITVADEVKITPVIEGENK